MFIGCYLGSGEYDEQMLNLTHAVLSKNPDISTFWNIRRKTLDILIDNQKVSISSFLLSIFDVIGYKRI